MDYRGAVVTPLETQELEALGEELEKLCASGDLQAVAVNLLFSYLNSSHEVAVGKWLEQRFPRLSISLSHQVASIWREYERGITTIADAYLKPLLREFISGIDGGLRRSGFCGGCCGREGILSATASVTFLVLASSAAIWNPELPPPTTSTLCPGSDAGFR